MDYSHIKTGSHPVNGVAEGVECNVIVEKADKKEIVFHIETNSVKNIGYIDCSIVVQLHLLEDAGIFKKAIYVL